MEPGKSSLLKVIAGLYPPSSGEVRVTGEVTLLSGLGMECWMSSVLKKIFSCTVRYAVWNRKKIKENLREIIQWAELQGFERAKLKTLSTGMNTRLAFFNNETHRVGYRSYG